MSRRRMLIHMGKPHLNYHPNQMGCHRGVAFSQKSRPWETPPTTDGLYIRLLMPGVSTCRRLRVGGLDSGTGTLRRRMHPLHYQTRKLARIVSHRAVGNMVWASRDTYPISVERDVQLSTHQAARRAFSSKLIRASGSSARCWHLDRAGCDASCRLICAETRSRSQ